MTRHPAVKPPTAQHRRRLLAWADEAERVADVLRANVDRLRRQALRWRDEADRA